MALGTLTRTGIISREGIYIDECTLVGEASYAAGGSAGLQALLQALTKDSRAIFRVEGKETGYILSWDKTNGKLMVFYSNSDAADGPLIEVADATVLSGITFKILISSN